MQGTSCKSFDVIKFRHLEITDFSESQKIMLIHWKLIQSNNGRLKCTYMYSTMLPEKKYEPKPM